MMALVAVLGTTISPYLFFWQAGQEVEELRRRHVKPLCITPRTAGSELARIGTDTILGKGVSNLIALFIIFAPAATLNAHSTSNIQTSSQAAEALRPIAGAFTFALFAIRLAIRLAFLTAQTTVATMQTFLRGFGGIVAGRAGHRSRQAVGARARRLAGLG